MGVIRDNRTSIVAGGLISASYVSDVYNVLTANSIEDIVLSGSLSVSGSLTAATLTGTADSASYVLSSSVDGITNYVRNSQTSSMSVSTSLTSSYVTGSMGTSISITSASIDRLDVQSGIVFITGSLPTSDPVVPGQLWRSGSYLMISTGSGS
jgi:hypothetical protein|tara:strand:+ start:1686 stop:2144 length:459 start_codon:yes stop_codon:yes gene_type:complete